MSLSAAALLIGAAAVPAAAGNAPEPLTDPARAVALAHGLGDDRTGGVYYQDGRLVVAVTDRAAARTVRDAGGTPKLVARSAAELMSLHARLDRLGAIPNAAWGVEAGTNQVSVEVFDGVPAAGRARIAEVAAAHPGAIRVDRIHGRLAFKAADLRGGDGITSEGYLCSAGFNAKNASGAVFTVTAGHCVPEAGSYWDKAGTDAGIGATTAYNFATGTGGQCDGVTRACDWATIRANDPDINPVGAVRYGEGDYTDIDGSRYATEGEAVDRIGATSQDTSGRIIATDVTVGVGGKQLYGMYESNVCALGGDSGGPLLHGRKALGLLSGGTGETVCDSTSTGDYRNFFTPVQLVLDQRDLHVY